MTKNLNFEKESAIIGKLHTKQPNISQDANVTDWIQEGDCWTDGEKKDVEKRFKKN